MNRKRGRPDGHTLAVRGGQRLMWLVKMVFIVGFCFTILYPLAVMLSRAFMSRADIFDNAVILVPRELTLDNIRYAAQMMNYGPTLWNTLWYALSTTVMQTLSTMMVGYGFARFRFRGSRVLFGLVVFTIILPPQLIMVPLYMHFRFFDIFGIAGLLTGTSGLNLLDSFTPFYLLSLGCVGIKNGIFIYMFRQFFKNGPKETEEAALVDGAGAFRIFFRIMIPSAITMLVTVALFSFVWQYNDVTYTNLFLKNNRVLSMTYSSLGNFLWDNMSSAAAYLKTDEYIAVIKSTGVLLMILPLLLIYLVMQRFFVDGIERSGIVG